VERFRAEMAGSIARRHSDRARAFGVLFPHRYLHRSQHCLEFDSVALLNFQTLIVRFWAHPVATGLVARLMLRLGARCANGPQGRGYKGCSNQTRLARDGTAEMPPLPEDAIDASLRRRDRERRNDHWTGPGSSGTEVETAVCAHCRQNTLPLVRTIL